MAEHAAQKEEKSDSSGLLFYQRQVSNLSLSSAQVCKKIETFELKSGSLLRRLIYFFSVEPL